MAEPAIKADHPLACCVAEGQPVRYKGRRYLAVGVIGPWYDRVNLRDRETGELLAIDAYARVELEPEPDEIQHGALW